MVNFFKSKCGFSTPNVIIYHIPLLFLYFSSGEKNGKGNVFSCASLVETAVEVCTENYPRGSWVCCSSHVLSPHAGSVSGGGLEHVVILALGDLD